MDAQVQPIDQINQAALEIKKKLGSLSPQFGVILGSGLGGFAELIEDKIIIPYEEIPDFPISTVEGHCGRLVAGRIGERSLIALQGRFHYYEGYDMQEVTFPVRVLKSLGIKGLIVTNAAGGVNTAYAPGDLIIIEDHINLIGRNPLRGKNYPELGPRFPDLSEAYDPVWRKTASEAMAELGITPQQGIYAGLSGPSYETPAEIRYLRTIGADLVGMSTVPEVIVANHGGMRVLGLSCVTNMAAGVLKQKLNHREVIETTEKIEKTFVALLTLIIKKLDD
ncbi:purine nucleoside phosphorylase I, inosine and guanosine-specific [Syntrophobotulus glycolicus DSM 8271]|uniref:Purine nucleoside phosphorylase n=1 Tax=Syntrophobotulus glycolicus (strain DSM 8271 / FlGlyR) TaxID=645991 RepID=F0T079_SYNGF|nr:purine-nucleoside phosphorylase [Syntrophobotulus glycolicus]ADY56166.1 purine nucleoside phosphorylase I, inosine and guanosine-specific [Syntrophobotulus glycolicus DSM 8271]